MNGAGAIVLARLRLHSTETNPELFGWIWRDPSLAEFDVEGEENFILHIVHPGARHPHTMVELYWDRFNPSSLKIKSSDPEPTRSVGRAVYFLTNGPRLTNGKYTYKEGERGTKHQSDWTVPAWDYNLVSCGFYQRSKQSIRFEWKKPSPAALEWVANPKMFLVPTEIKERMLEEMQTPLWTGERKTIRRIFH